MSKDYKVSLTLRLSNPESNHGSLYAKEGFSAFSIKDIVTYTKHVGQDEVQKAVNSLDKIIQYLYKHKFLEPGDRYVKSAPLVLNGDKLGTVEVTIGEIDENINFDYDLRITDKNDVISGNTDITLLVLNWNTYELDTYYKLGQAFVWNVHKLFPGRVIPNYDRFMLTDSNLMELYAGIAIRHYNRLSNGLKVSTGDIIDILNDIRYPLDFIYASGEGGLEFDVRVAHTKERDKLKDYLPLISYQSEFNIEAYKLILETIISSYLNNSRVVLYESDINEGVIRIVNDHDENGELNLEVVYV